MFAKKREKNSRNIKKKMVKKKTEVEVLKIRVGEQALSLVPSKSRLKKSGRRKAKCENVEFRRLE